MTTEQRTDTLWYADLLLMAGALSLRDYAELTRTLSRPSWWRRR